MNLSFPVDKLDLNNTEKGYKIALFCYPDSLGWKNVIRSTFSSMTRGRFYYGGDWRPTQRIATTIYESLDMECDTALRDIADCLCLIAKGYGLNLPGGELPGDELLCNRAKGLLGVSYYYALELSKIEGITLTASTVIGVFSRFLDDGWAKDLLGSFADGLRFLFTSTATDIAGIVIPQLEIRTEAEYLNLADNILENQALLIQALFDSVDAIEARTNFDQAVDSTTMSLWQRDYLKNMLSDKRLKSSYDGSMDDVYDTSKAALWFTYECVGSGPEFNFDCFPQLGYVSYGTPLIINNSAWDIVNYPVLEWVNCQGTWYTEPGLGGWRFNGACDDDYDLEWEILTVPDQKTLQLQLTDCDNNFIVDSDDIQPGFTITTKCDQFFLRTLPQDDFDSGNFTFRVRRLN